MARLSLRPAAQDDIDDTALYIAQDSFNAGLAFLQAVDATFEKLLDMPGLGRERTDLAVDHLPGLRSYPVRGFENWLVFYVCTEDTIDIIRILHGARDLPGDLETEG